MSRRKASLLRKAVMNFMIVFAILNMVPAVISYVFAMEFLFDPYFLVGVHGMKNYPFWSSLRIPAYLFSIVLVGVLLFRFSRYLKGRRMGAKTRKVLQWTFLVVFLFASSFLLREYQSYINKHYGEVYADEYIDDSNEKEMVIKGIPYPHRTWFQRFLKTDAAFGEIMNGEEYGILGATVRVLRTEEVPRDWWRYRFWEKIEFLNFWFRYFYFLEVLIWVVCWKIKDIEIGSDI